MKRPLDVAATVLTPPVFHPLALALIAITAALVWRRVPAGKG